jgi:hypothetical protein
MEGTVASENKLVGTLSSGGTMAGGMGTVFARDGKDGVDGFSPIVEVSETEPGWQIAITDSKGTQYFDVGNGVDGASAYEIAVSNGFEGTEEEWLASLHGKNGKDGYSPVLYATEMDDGYEIYLEDANDSNFINIYHGKDGVDGTVAFEELTEAQRESLRGEPGESYVLTDADKREIADMIEGSEATVPQEVIDHISIEGNPHKTTAEQVGAVTKEQHDKDIKDAKDLAYNLHLSALDEVDSVAENVRGVQDDIANNYNTKTEVDAKIADTKAVIVTVNGTTPSHTSKQIYALIQAGKTVYLQLWGNTYIICSACTESEAKFENSIVTTVTGADEKSYSAQKFRLYFIKGDKYSSNSTDVPAQAYVDAQITTALENASIAYVGSATPTNDMGKDGDIYIVSG